MNIRRCQKCNGIVPEGNSTCNNCGHKMSFFGGSGLYVGSSKNANKIDAKENPFSDGKNNAGCVGWFVFIFMAVIFFQVYMIMKADFKENGISLEDIFNELEEDFDNFEDFEDFVDENYCHTYCGSNEYEVGANTNCLCYNGDIYDSEGNKLYTGIANEEENLNGRCSLYCKEDGIVIDDVCYCKNGSLYDIQGFNYSNGYDYVARNLMTKIQNGETLFIYGPGSYKEDYLNPIELVNFMNKYDMKVYYFDFSELEGTIRHELRTTYGFQNYVMPHYYIFENGNMIHYDMNVETKEELQMSLDMYFSN